MLHKNRFYSFLVLAVLLLAACQPIQPPVQNAPNAASTATVAPLLGNLGDHTHPITIQLALAQKYFDEGFNLTSC